MPTKSVKTTAASGINVPPQDLPDDGTPVTFSQTWAKQVGGKPAEDDRIPSDDDFEDAEWEVRRQTPDGWEFLERVESRPCDQDLRENYGAGKFEIYPIDPRTGKPVKQIRKVRLISQVVGGATSSVLPFPTREIEDLNVAMPMAGNEEVPAWMRWQMQQQAEERAEARRRADEALIRQREFEEKLALKEFERQEREERQKDAERKAAAAEAQRRDDRFNTLLTAGLGLAQAFMTNRQSTPQKDVNEVLLRELMEERRSRTPQANGMRDSLELLMVLDKLAASRAEMAAGSRRDDDDDDDDGMMKSMLTSMLPSILSGGRGGGGGGTPQLPPEMIDGIIEQAFSNPEVIQKVAMRNPTGIAKSFMTALKANPALESAVLDAVEKASGDGDEE